MKNISLLCLQPVISRQLLRKSCQFFVGIFILFFQTLKLILIVLCKLEFSSFSLILFYL